MSGSNHFVEGKVVPKWDYLVDEEDLHDGWYVIGISFKEG